MTVVDSMVSLTGGLLTVQLYIQLTKEKTLRIISEKMSFIRDEMNDASGVENQCQRVITNRDAIS